MTADLAAWLTEIWDEQEKAARHILDGGHWHGIHVNSATEVAVHIEAWNPERVLARIAADRQILAEFVARDKDMDLMLGPDCLRQREWSGLRLALLLKAGQYKDRPGFNPDWRVDRPHP